MQAPAGSSVRVTDLSSNAWATINSSAGWTAAATKRMKENITDITYGLDTVMALRAVEFDSRIDGRHDIGLIAQEVEEVVPEIVGNMGAEEGEIDFMTLRKDALVAVLIKAVRELTQDSCTGIGGALMALDFPAPAGEGQTYSNDGATYIYHNNRWMQIGSTGGGSGGGGDGLDAVVNDPSPQLGGDLDLNGHVIGGMVLGVDVQPYSSILANTTASFTTADEAKLDALPNAAGLATIYAPIDNPGATGDPKSVTPAPGDNDTSIATTAFVTAAVAAAGGGLDTEAVQDSSVAWSRATRKRASLSRMTMHWANSLRGECWWHRGNVVRPRVSLLTIRRCSMAPLANLSKRSHFSIQYIACID